MHPNDTHPEYPRTVMALRAAGCVFAEDEARLLHEEASGSASLREMIDRRIEGEPLEAILGWAEFHGLRISVDRGVFVPRRRTELLARTAISHTRTHFVVLDLCCGTGAVAAAIAHDRPGIELHAADIDPAAIRSAHRNLDGIGEVHEGDLFDALPRHLRGRIDLLTVNAPYVPTEAIGSMPPEARTHEPHVALDGGADGLDIHRAVLAEAPSWLAAGGHLLIETSRQQAEGTHEAFTRHGFDAHVHHDPDVDGTLVLGTAPAAIPGH